jgi:diguanylate cyclase (GGDEF)-like protein/PAS domain S-box-containing protein
MAAKRASARASDTRDQARPARGGSAAARTRGEDPLGVLFERASVGVVRFSADGRVVQANRVLEEMLGYPIEELSQMSFYEYTHPEDLDATKHLHRELLEGERDSYNYEKRYVRRDGQTIWCRVTVWEDTTPGAPAKTGVAMLEDITARKVAEIALNEKADRLERIIATQRDIAAAAGDLERVMGVIVERAQALTQADGAMISLIDGDDVVTRAACGVAEAHLNNRRPLTETVARFAIQSGQPLLIEQAEGDRRLNRGLSAAIGDRSHICVPLFTGEEAVGALSLIGISEEERLGEEDRQTVELLAGALSAGVSRAAEAEAKRRQLDALTRFEAIYQGALTGVIVVNATGRILDVNPAMTELLGAEAAHLLDSSILDHIHADDREEVSSELYELTRGDASHLRLDHRFVRPDGGAIWVYASYSVIREDDGRPRFGIVMVQDVTDRKAAEQALVRQAELNEHQARHDALTGLPNRMLFRDRIEQEITAARHDGGCAAVAVMDLDGFKEVNDSLGHHAGDALLMQIGERLRKLLRSSDVLSRLGGDEFGLLISKPRSTADIQPVIDKVRRALEEPVVVEDLPLTIEASIGIAVFPQDGEDVETLLRRADMAMYCAKEEKSGFAYFDSERKEADPARLTLVSELRRAIDQRELVLFYQPKATLANGAVESVEALLRWNHPARGIVPPDEFIPLAQQTGLIKPLTLYVIDDALRQCRAWSREGLTLSVAVNLSVRNLLDVEFPEQVSRLLKKRKVNPALLELEITESTMLADPMRTKVVLEKLSAMGVSLSIDDFGTGYSSLAYLSQLPVNEIKIDRSFVMNMDASENDAVIVRSTIDLGRNLGLQVVAEGVETRQAWNELAELGCTLAQGYYLSRPIPADELTAWLKQRAAGARAAKRAA